MLSRGEVRERGSGKQCGSSGRDVKVRTWVSAEGGRGTEGMLSAGISKGRGKTAGVSTGRGEVEGGAYALLWPSPGRGRWGEVLMLCCGPPPGRGEVGGGAYALMWPSPRPHLSPSWGTRDHGGAGLGGCDFIDLTIDRNTLRACHSGGVVSLE